MGEERSSGIPPELARDIAAHLRETKGKSKPLCPACGRRPQETSDGFCHPCASDRRERELVSKRKWWTKHADAERMAKRSLEEIAEDVHESYALGKQSYEQSIEAYLAIGRDLRHARECFAADQDFGRWFREQRFEFSLRWAWTLREAAAHEDAIRELVGTQVPTDARPSIKRALAMVRNTPASSGTRQESSAGCRHCPIHCECA